MTVKTNDILTIEKWGLVFFRHDKMALHLLDFNDIQQNKFHSGLKEELGN